ncbi:MULTISPECIES: 3-oxoacyl-ACP reductase FabG [Streptomyces]|jgi:3-oxoacyl-[acyl-carrier protein] reductase|uniref:3-oxoacyl-ACP reductase FabG n=1 Tax=Streptomyces mirabilis TaxID=68239 RepID=A0ABU3UKA6_9ACTN|nr:MULTISPECIES: 3-oxoacyl-ACP reductase FabG [Streptomyces]KPI05413.1 3-oxoacyl-(acyl-carrier-protein) reductase [Actinobacteria bacterium OK006]MCX4421298.1 3-oxoacyl-ACP reductase FabG [Streptomyces mirabilis]MCX4611906.1 3-oxoacyl-ACP reductase FabG [Streptomyces mirabilis]MCX5352152.1 3-oxoacyl-ACP reductase FabG [Streptomyces mirabilis]MDU8994366.1 3-oxoacyl-ACP reductase FabG [Streptomyces mirabilis]
MSETPSPVALVSGGSRGIGRAIVHRLAHDGYDVAFCYRSSEDSARELEKEVARLGRRAVPTRVDVADADGVRAWVRGTEDELGPIDAVVTSAGVTKDGALALMPDENWHSVLDVNLDGMYNVCRSAIFEMMKSKSGVIVNLSSVAGVHGHARQTNYAAAKAGIIGFTRSLAKEVGPYGIRANVVAPGYIDTDMTAVLSPKVTEDAVGRTALRRMGRAGEVADLVSFLVSPRAAYITGTVLEIDGGISL